MAREVSCRSWYPSRSIIYLLNWFLDPPLPCWCCFKKHQDILHLYHSFITITSWWARWRLKSPASQVFTQPFLSGTDQRKHQSSASLAFAVTGEFPTRRASNAESVSTWWCHHVNLRWREQSFAMEIRTCLFKIVHIIVADGLVTQGVNARSSNCIDLVLHEYSGFRTERFTWFDISSHSCRVIVLTEISMFSSFPSVRPTSHYPDDRPFHRAYAHLWRP